MKSQTRAIGALSIALLLGLAGCASQVSSDESATQDENAAALKSVTGNGGPSGAHYELEIIGMSNPKSATITSGNRIFVPMYGSCRINLSEGSFDVLDGNCTDGTSAFQLPNPDPTTSGT